MEVIAISQFKATCLAVLERVRKTGEPILVTRRGKPVAQVQPPPPPEPKSASLFGSMKGTAEVVGDIVSPLSDQDWVRARVPEFLRFRNRQESRRVDARSPTDSNKTISFSGTAAAR